MPLTELISHLSIPNLKFIAQCHNITIRSKSKSLEIQSIIESHKCKSCGEYVEIFEFIDEKDKIEKKKAINLSKSKKYQEKNYESSEVRRDSFIIPGIEDFFSALTQNLAFFPRKLMARFPAQNGSQVVLGSKLNGILLKLFHA